jgi:long-chain acyl-CoA synthetase
MTGFQLPESVVTVPQLWAAASVHDPQRVVYRHKRRGVWTGVSNRELFETAKVLGLGLHDARMARGAVVSILSENRPEWVAMDLAAQSMGYVAHSLYPTASENDLVYALVKAGTSVILVEDVTQLVKVLAVRGRCPSLSLIILIERKGLGSFEDVALRDYGEFLAHGRSLVAGKGKLFDANVADGRSHDIACLIQTSGSSGSPRLSAASHASLLEAVKHLPDWLDIRSGDRSLSVMPLANAAERTLSMLAPLVVPLQVHFPENGATVLNDLKDVAPQVLNALPRFWSVLRTRTEGSILGSSPSAVRRYKQAIAAERPGVLGRLILSNLRRSLGLGSLRIGISGNAPLSPILREWFEHLGTPLANAYGVTEAGGYVRVDLPACDSLECSAGQIDGIDMQLSLHNEILVSGPMMHVGYWDAQRESKILGHAGQFGTGDQASALGTARLRLTGRHADRLRLKNGLTVDISVFRDAMTQNEEILDLVVFGDGQEFLTAVVALDHHATGQFARKRNIPYTDHASLVSRPEIISLVAAQIDLANALMSDAAKVRQFRILSVVLDGSSEELSPALRLKQVVVGDKYSSLIQEMYRQSA